MNGSARRIDLHTHSLASDGRLTPRELVDAAARRAVRLLALTDHDTTAGLAEAAGQCAQHDIQFVPGVELTCEWKEREIHVVGLQVAAQQQGLQQHLQEVCALRRQRMAAMCERLTAHGLPGQELLAECSAAPSPTRAHLARALHARGAVGSLEEAFERWLGRKGRAYVKSRWPTLATVVECIVAAGGIAVLAHPHRYRCSAGQLRELCGIFAIAGGRGIEVSLAGMGPGDAASACSLARRFELAGSIGSDFHEPGLPWRPLGRFDKLPDGVTPITALLESQGVQV
ncbi:MAG: PHP domain-containing protein [Steroidobacteraceae bacterium]